MKRLIATIALALLVVPATFAGEQSLLARVTVFTGPAAMLVPTIINRPAGDYKPEIARSIHGTFAYGKYLCLPRAVAKRIKKTKLGHYPFVRAKSVAS